MNKTVTRTIALVAAIFLLGNISHAASFKSLKSKGYKVGKLTKNRAGKSGWILKKGDDRQFCRSKVSGIILNSKTLIFMTSSGRQIKADRKVFEERSGPSEKLYPTMSQYKSGRIDARSVGRCSKLK